jgi:hypothetical protein
LTPKSPPIPPPLREAAAVPFFDGSITRDERIALNDAATDSIADSASADVSRHFRERYADIQRIIRESATPAGALSEIESVLRRIRQFDPIEQTLIANALNALA